MRNFAVMEKETELIYSAAVIDFVTVSTEYCKLLEQCQGADRSDFVNTMLKLLPMIYLKASFLPEMEESEGFNNPAVTEEDYNYIQQIVRDLIGEEDDYLDTFQSDYKYSDQPIRVSISENMADVYQALRNFIEIYRQGIDEAMEVALYDVSEAFKLYWGLTLLNALRALHAIQFPMD